MHVKNYGEPKFRTTYPPNRGRLQRGFWAFTKDFVNKARKPEAPILLYIAFVTLRRRSSSARALRVSLSHGETNDSRGPRRGQDTGFRRSLGHVPISQGLGQGRLPGALVRRPSRRGPRHRRELSRRRRRHGRDQQFRRESLQARAARPCNPSGRARRGRGEAVSGGGRREAAGHRIDGAHGQAPHDGGGRPRPDARSLRRAGCGPRQGRSRRPLRRDDDGRRRSGDRRARGQGDHGPRGDLHVHLRPDGPGRLQDDDGTLARGRRPRRR